MASFPNAIKQFITKIAHVDKVQSADINDLQNEVNAIETTLLSGTEGQVLTSGSTSVSWETLSGGGGLASFSYEPGENETWDDLFVLYPAAAEALHLNLNEQYQGVRVLITLQLAESPYHMFEIVRASNRDSWYLGTAAFYSSDFGSAPTSGTYNILSVRMELAMM